MDKRVRRWVLVLLLGMSATGMCGAEEDVTLVRQQGAVQLDSRDGRQVVTTGADGRAVVKAGAAGFLVVERNSRLEIARTNGAANVFRQLSGMVFYALNRLRADSSPLQVHTATAVIGVRGTRFLVVEQAGRQEIGMRKGQVTVTSAREEFEIHRRQEQDEFAAFRQEANEAMARERRAFADYQAKNAREFVEFRREFQLGADRMVSFDGQRVTETALGEQTRREMEGLEQFAAQWLPLVED
ncbi:MAG: FecR family protein [Pseudomonadota bacterium]